MRKLAKMIGFVLTAAVILLLLCNLWLIGAKTILGQSDPTVFGYSGAVLLSGSMSGSMEVNDMVIIHREETYAPGDVITFRSGNALVTHRILEDTQYGFITKGDANNAADLQPVPHDQVQGKVVLVVPGVGNVIRWLRSPLGLCVLAITGLAVLLIPGSAPAAPRYKKGGEEYEAL